MKKTITPIGGRILVEPFKEQEYKGGLYIPEQAREKQLRGIVVALGTGALKEDGTTIPFTVVVGDEVLFPRFGDQHEVEGEDGKLLILNEADLLGVAR